MPADSYAPDKRTLGQVLSKTSPPLRVPDYQRDFSWEKEHVAEFWDDVIAFDCEFPGRRLSGHEYFIGATVLVNNGDYHLLLDGQQRLATTTILLAALRDKAGEYNRDAANQIQDQFITYEDAFTKATTAKLELNVFDREFFRDVIQLRTAPDKPATKRSHKLIRNAYEMFCERINAERQDVGGGERGFLRIGRIKEVLVDHVSVVAVISNDQDTADRVFTTLNDRGIGLSPADQLRSWTLQRSPDENRDEILACWNDVFDACGTSERSQVFIRLSWVARHGDVKSRAIHKVMKEALGNDPAEILAYCRELRSDAEFYHQLRTGTCEDDELGDLWLAVKKLRANAGYALLLAANGRLDLPEQKLLAQSLVSLVVRHNIVCKMDRTRFETTVFQAARDLSHGGGLDAAIEALRSISPTDERFQNAFADLSFSKNDHGIAQLILRGIEAELCATDEKVTAPPTRVHLEHIYPQNPPDGEAWEQHEEWLVRLGNMTLLDHRLNTGIKNSDFATKKQAAYEVSEIHLNQDLKNRDDWSSEAVVERQARLGDLAASMWPATLRPQPADAAAG